MKTHRRFNYEWVFVLGGLLLGLAWFAHNLDLPGSARGLDCCDAEHYIALSGGASRVSDLLRLVGNRTFGYPTFLGSMRLIYSRLASPDRMAWLPFALTVQMSAWILSILVLFYALRRMSRSYSLVALGMILAHPAFSSYAAVPVTDTLASSLFCVAIACAVYMSGAATAWYRLAVAAAIAGFILSCATSMRPNFQLVSVLFPVIVGLERCIIGYRAGSRVGSITKQVTVIVVFYLLGYLPIYAKLVSNCYGRYEQFCILEPTTMAYAQQMTVEMGVSGVRNFHSGSKSSSTGDPFISRVHVLCLRSLGTLDGVNPMDWLLRCYAAQPWRVPLLLFKKSIAAFDNYALSVYATDATPTSVFYVSHIFSLFGFLGFFAAAFHCVRVVLRRENVPIAYLALPLVYAGMQLNLHIETRFFFPVYPIFFLFWFATVWRYSFLSLARQILFWVAQGMLALAFFVQAWAWSRFDCPFFVDLYAGSGREIPSNYMIASCPRGQEAVDWKEWYLRVVPDLPLGYD